MQKRWENDDGCSNFLSRCIISRNRQIICVLVYLCCKISILLYFSAIRRAKYMQAAPTERKEERKADIDSMQSKIV